MWWAEAGKYNVLLLDVRFVERALSREMTGKKERTSYTFYPGTVRIPEAHVRNRSHSITAEIEVPFGSAEGPICASFCLLLFILVSEVGKNFYQGHAKQTDI
jgi:arylsulfatase